MPTQADLGAFQDAILAADSDLQKWESRMPDAAKAVTAPNGKSAYYGKRDLAKWRIASILQSRGMVLAGLQDLTQLATVAALLELALIFRDMAWRDNTISAEKADYYMDQFDQYMSSLSVDYIEPAIAQTGSKTRAFKCVPVSRA